MPIHKTDKVNTKVKGNNTTILQIAIIGLLFALTYIYIFNPKLDMGGDNYNYLNYATSIISGHGYASPYTPEYKPTNWFPPGYSCILASGMLLFGKNIVLLKILNGLFFLGCLVLLLQLFQKITSQNTLSITLCILLLANPHLLYMSTILMSEMSFLFFTILCIWHIPSVKEQRFWRSRNFYIIMLSSVIAYYIRSVGIVLICSVFLYWLAQKKWKLAGIYITGSFTIYLPWLIRNAIHGIKGRYIDTLTTVNPWHPEQGQIETIGAMGNKFLENLFETVLKGFPDTIMPYANIGKLPVFLIIIIGMLTLGVIIIGLLKLKNLRTFFLIYILGSIAVLLIWHGGNGVRYVWPLIPFITCFFFYGLYQILSLLPKSQNYEMQHWLPYTLLVLLLLYIPNLQALHNAPQENTVPAYANYIEVANTIKKFNKPDMMVACRKPGMFHYYSETYVCRYKFTTDNNKLLKGLIDNEAKFIVVDQLGYNSTHNYLAPAVNNNPELFRTLMKVKKDDEFYTYLLQFNINGARRKLNYY